MRDHMKTSLFVFALWLTVNARIKNDDGFFSQKLDI